MNKRQFESEAEFLRQYDPTTFDPFSLTTDLLVFSVSDGEKESYRRLPEKHFSLLLVKRSSHPFCGKWCLPGGFVRLHESIDEAAVRVLKHETNLSDIYMEQLYTFGAPDRDPRMRIASTAYMALVDKDRLRDRLDDQASWFHLTVRELEDSVVIDMDNGEENLSIRLKKALCHRTVNSYKFEVIQNERLAFDHALVIAEGMNRIKNKLQYTDIVFNMMPSSFTLGELQRVFEVILGRKLLDSAFRRMIADTVEKTGKFRTGGGHRPSAFYRYKKQ